MPYVYTQDKNGRFRASGSLTEAEVTPAVGGGGGFGKPKPKRKPKPQEKPWWWHITPQGMANDLQYEQKRLATFNRQPEPRRTGAMGAVQGVTRAIQRTTPLGRLYQDVLPAAGRQMVMGATVRAAEDAGLAAVNFAQRALGNANRIAGRVSGGNPVARAGASAVLMSPPVVAGLGLFGPARDPEATPAGRAIVNTGRTLRMANRARVREEIKPEDDLIEAIPAGFAANVALAPLTAPIGGAVIKGAGMAAKAGRWGVDLAANEAAANLVTDNTMGGPSALLKAVGVPVPDALSADPTRDDRISAGLREIPAAMAIAGPMGLVLGAGADALGRALEQVPNVTRSIRENRMVQELRNARQKTVGNGLQEVDPATGEHTFTPAAKTEPPPPAPPAPPVAGPAPIPSRPDAGIEDFGNAMPGPLPEVRNPGADPWMDDAQYQDWLRQKASREIVPVQQGDAAPIAPPVQRQPLAPQDELRGEGLADPWGMGPDPNSPVQQALGQKPGAAYTGSSIEEPAAAPTVKESLTAEEEFYDPELPEIDQAAVALERLEPDVIEQILQTPGPVLPQIEEALASKQPVAPRPELSAVDVTAPSDKLAGSVVPRREEWGNLPDDSLLGVFHPQVNPGLFSLIESRTGRSFEELTRNDAIETLSSLADQGATVIPNRLMSGIDLARAADLEVDPVRFQYKLNTDRRGVQKGNSLEGLERWNTNMEGALLVWEDPANGKLYVVNGHNRLAKALELGIPTVPVKRLLASTAEQARALGALDNIASGGGTPWDAAKFFREAGITDESQAAAAGIPLKSEHKMPQRGLQLAQLPDNIFQAGLAGDLPEPRALELGASGLSPEKMQTVWSEYQKDKFFRSESNFPRLIDLARDTPTTTADSGGRVKQGEIPGMESPEQRDLTKLKVKLANKVKANLSDDRRALKGAAKNADTLEVKGNSQIDADTAMQAGLDAEQMGRVFDALWWASGSEVSKLLNAGAEEVAAGAKLEAVARRIQGELAQAADKVMLPKPPEPVVPEPVAPEAPEAPMPRSEADIEAAKLTLLNRAAAGGEVRPSATPIPDLPKVKPGIDLQDVATSADQLKLAQQQRQAALDSGDTAAVAAWDKEIRRINQGRLAADQATRDTSQTGLFGETEYDTTLPLLDPRLQAEEARLEAEYRQRDAAAQADMARAEREAAGYQDMTFEEKKTEFGITEGWKPPEAAPPAPKPLPDPTSKAGKDLAKKLAQLEELLANARDVRLPAALGRRDRLAANGMPSESAEDLVEQLQRQIPNLEKQISDLRAEYGMAAADAPAAAPARSFTFPEDLAKSAPRYGQATLTFASDYDRAAYILRDASKKSKGEDQLIKALEGQGIDVAEVRAHGKRVHAAIKALSKEQTGSTRAPLKAVDLKVPEQGGASRIEDASIAPEGWDSFETSSKSGAEIAATKTMLTGIIRRVAGDEAVIRFGDIYDKQIKPKAWGGDGVEESLVAGRYTFDTDLIQVFGINTRNTTDLIETAFHESFHRIQFVALGSKEVKTLDGLFARLKIDLGARIDGIAYSESQAVAFQRYARARFLGQDPIAALAGVDLYSLGRAPTRLEKTATAIISAFDKISDFVERSINAIQGNGFNSAKGIFERAYEGALRDTSWDGLSPGFDAMFRRWRKQNSAREALNTLLPTLREADGGKLKGVSKRALQLAEEGSPDQALREATDYAQRRLADIDNEIEAIKQRAIKEGC